MNVATLSQVKSQRSFHSLPSHFYAEVTPSGLSNPTLAAVSQTCAHWLGLDPSCLSDNESLQILSGNSVPESWRPLAMKYVGHQFGYLNPDLGDGRGLLLAEIKNPEGELVDLHLKGAGVTPYSRDGDGRAVLRSSIREFLGSEAMHGLGIPTSRALCVVDSDTPVQREQAETGAMLLRATRSHIRFGHFEYAYHHDRHAGNQDALIALSNYVAQRYFPSIHGRAHQNADMFRLICESTARMIVKWQLVGFNHGVMNTDNMSILGETFDYGPFGFMDTFNAQHICNHSDHQGRYAFNQQPGIAHWNLSVLAQAFSPLVDTEALNEGLQAYSEVFNEGFMSGMRQKLGLSQSQASDQNLIFDTLQMLQHQRLDYTRFFSALSRETKTSDLRVIQDDGIDPKQFKTWQKQFKKRLESEAENDPQRQSAMQATNPVYVLRNHLAQEAIAAAQTGDYGLLNKLHKALENPFEEKAEYAEFKARPPESAQGIALSCSS